MNTDELQVAVLKIQALARERPQAVRAMMRLADRLLIGGRLRDKMARLITLDSEAAAAIEGLIDQALAADDDEPPVGPRPVGDDVRGGARPAPR